MEVVDKISDHEVVKPQDFVAWLTTQKNANGSLFLYDIAKKYAYSLSTVPPKLDIPLTAEEYNVFYYSSIDEFDRLCEIFRNAPNYRELNHRYYHGAFSAGLGAYRRYLENHAGHSNYSIPSVNNDLFSILENLEKTNVPDTVIRVLMSDYSNGFIFDSTTIRLLSNKSGVAIDNEIQSILKHGMFQRNDGVYFLPDVAASAELRRKIADLANDFFDKYGFFEVSRLYSFFADDLNVKCVNSVDNFEAFFMYINRCHIRFITLYGIRIVYDQSKRMRNLLSDVAIEILDIAFNENNGVVSEDILQNRFPAFSTLLLSKIIEEYAKELVKTEINGITCYQAFNTLGLPDNFSEVLTETLYQLDDLGLAASEDILHTALSMRLNVNFKAEYNILNNKTYQRLIATCYKGTPKREWKHGIFTKVLS